MNMEDWQLLHEYAARKSETAFRALVERHLGLVRSAAVRQVRDPQLADEVTQAVFILLARKAGNFGRGVVLPGWLYRTTHFVASRAQRAELRRQRREQEAFAMHQLSSPNEAWRRISPWLDEAMERLGEKDRNAVILRFFQDQSLIQVANKLGVSEEAAKKRVARALDKLRGFFARRGFIVSGTVLSAALAAHSVQAVPAGMSGLIACGALAHGAAAPAALPALVQQTIAAWRWSKFKLAAGLAAGGFAAALLLHNTFSATPANPKLVGTAANATQPTDPTSASTTGPAAAEPPLQLPQTNPPHLAFRAVDAETSAGVAHAKVLLVTGRDWGNIKQRTDLATDNDGRCDVPLPYSDPDRLFVGALADGYVQKCFVWRGPGKEPLPKEYVLKLERGASIGGLVQDQSGNPVSGAEIQVQFMDTGDNSGHEFQSERHGFPSDDLPSAKTDAAGRWSFGSASKKARDFWVKVKHPAFPNASFRPDADGQNSLSPESVTANELFAGTAVLVLKSGLKVAGIVTGDQQNPISGAKVTAGHIIFSDSPSTTTAADGSFTLGRLSAGQTFLTVSANGFSAEREEVFISTNTPGQKIELKPGALLRLRVVDDTGAAMAHARVSLEQWRGQRNVLSWDGFTDESGRIEWNGAPLDPMTFFAHKEGYFYSRNNAAMADGEEHTITLHKEISVSGQVTDADTKEPIATFKVIPGSDPDSRQWERLSFVNGANGQYQLTFDEYAFPLLVRIEADGYDTVISSPLRTNATDQTFDAELSKLGPEGSVRGIVLLADGRPASGAEVALCTLERGITLSGGTFQNRREAIVVDADEAGGFSFVPDPDAHTVVAAHELGFGRAQLAGANQLLEIHLQPWGRVEGRLQLRGDSNAGREVTLYDGSVSFYRGPIALSYYAKTDDKGNFVFEKVPPGDFDLFYVAGLGIPFSQETPVEIKPGGTTRVQMISTGRKLVGRFVAPDAEQTIDWPKQILFANLGTKPEPLLWPKGLTAREVEKWNVEFWQSKEGRARIRALRGHSPKVKADGSFSIEDVPPGTYQFTATLEASSSGKPRSLGSVIHEAVVPEAGDDQSADPLDLGTLTMR